MNSKENNEDSEEYYDRYMSDLLISIFKLVRITIIILLIYLSFITLVEFKKHSDLFEDFLFPISISYYKLINFLDSGLINFLSNIGT